MTIEEEYRLTRKNSASLHERARQVIPSGIEHDHRHLKPFPFYLCIVRQDLASRYFICFVKRIGQGFEEGIDLFQAVIQRHRE